MYQPILEHDRHGHIQIQNEDFRFDEHCQSDRILSTKSKSAFLVKLVVVGTTLISGLSFRREASDSRAQRAVTRIAIKMRNVLNNWIVTIEMRHSLGSL